MGCRVPGFRVQIRGVGLKIQGSGFPYTNGGSMNTILV